MQTGVVRKKNIYILIFFGGGGGGGYQLASNYVGSTGVDRFRKRVVLIGWVKWGWGVGRKCLETTGFLYGCFSSGPIFPFRA